MAITRLAFEIFRQLIAHVPTRPVSMLSVGYPDSIVSEDALISMFGPKVLDGVAFREDSEQIIAWHSFQGLLKRIPETRSLLKSIGIEMTVTDISEIRGGEIICDLNHPIAQDLVGRFDIVLDAGTMEHCFNVGQVIVNLLSMAKKGGHVIHLNPLGVLNHGFFNFCPTFYADFYQDNGHRLAGPMFGFRNRGLECETFGVNPTQRMAAPPDGSWIAAIAQKMSDAPPKWPTQTKYKKAQSFAG